MFTGLIEQIAVVVSWEEASDDAPSCLRVRPITPFEATIGESIALNGVCLTAVSQDSDVIAFDVGSETLKCTTFANLTISQKMNLERALRMGDRLGGHLVSGHVDTTATTSHIEQRHDGWLFGFSFPKAWAQQVIKKGSIAIDGISLTINDVTDSTHDCRIDVCIIPTTLEVTNLRTLSVGDKVNIETDMIGKFALRASATDN